MSSAKLTALAKRFELIIEGSEVDALEEYPGEESSSREKLNAAAKAIIDDLNNIASQYYMYKEQIKQAERGVVHAKYLLEFGHELKEIIKNFESETSIDINRLQETLRDFKEKVITSSNRLGLHISLTELNSLRLLNALIADEASKSFPRIPPPDWSELARINRMERDEAIPETLRSPE